MSAEKKIEAGDEISSRCLKCKDVTNHTIIAMVGDKVAKVLCKVCGGRHNYRPAKPVIVKTPKKKTSKFAGTTASESAENQARFEKLLAARDHAKALSYSMSGIFKKDDLLDHSVFGLGLITKTIFPDKIEVLFREQSKLLICGRSPDRAGSIDNVLNP